MKKKQLQNKFAYGHSASNAKLPPVTKDEKQVLYKGLLDKQIVERVGF